MKIKGFYILLFVLIHFLSVPGVARGEEMRWILITPEGRYLPLGPGQIKPLEDPAAFGFRREFFSYTFVDGGAIDWGRNQLIGEYGHWDVRVGRQRITANSLIIGDLLRRGISVSHDTPYSAWTAFVIRNGDPAGPLEGLGLGQRGDRLGGASWELRPVRGDHLSLVTSFSLLSGETGTMDQPRSTQAWNMAAEARILSHLHLRSELAGTEFVRYGEEPAGSGSTSFRIDYGRGFGGRGGERAGWNFGVEKTRIETGFYSPGNPDLASDVDRTRFFGDLRWRSFRLQSAWSRETDNLAQNAEQPVIATSRSTISLDYLPERQPDFGKRLGRPFYGIILSRSERLQVDSPSGFTGLPVDSQTRRMQVQAGFQNENWKWELGHSISDYRDFTGLYDEVLSYATYLNALLRPASRLQLSPNLQFRRTVNEETESTSDSLSLGFKGHLILLPGRLKNNWDILFKQLWNSGDRGEREWELREELVWTWRQPRPGRAGFDLALRGSYRELDGRLSGDLQDYRIFLNLTMTLPLSS